MAARLAEPYGEVERLSNLIYSESRWNPTEFSNKEDCGLTQINLHWNPTITLKDCFNPEFAIRWTLYDLINGREYLYVVCNCYALVKTRISGLPKMVDIIPNSPPVVGGVAIQDFKGVKHVSYIKALTEKGVLVFEANYEPCKTDERLIEWNDPFLKGFWAAPEAAQSG